MEVSTSLIVILMFSSVVGIGVANILMTFAGVLSNSDLRLTRSIGAAWLLILLLTFLSMFWNSTLLLRREEWSFALFLFAITGPILLLFATNVMAQRLTAPPAAATTDADTNIRRFLVLFAMVHAWLIGMDQVLDSGWTWMSVGSAVLIVATLVLALVGNEGMRWLFTLFMLGVTIADIVLQSV